MGNLIYGQTQEHYRQSVLWLRFLLWRPLRGMVPLPFSFDLIRFPSASEKHSLAGFLTIPIRYPLSVPLNSISFLGAPPWLKTSAAVCSCVWWAVLLELPTREHQSTPKRAHTEEAATRKLVLTALAWVKHVNTWFEGSL